MKSHMPRSRRHFLQASLTAGGVGLALEDILQLQAQAESRGQSTPDTSVIQVWLGGGPSQFETFDPKPEAPAEIRGPYSTIQTKLPGVSFCETLPRTAMVLDRAAIIRTVTHATNNHFSGAHWCSTGYPNESNRSTHPSSGSIVSRFRGAINPGVPPYVLLSEEQTRNPEIATVMRSAYLGSQHAPFTILQDSFQPDFQQEKLIRATSNLTLADDFTLARVADRRSLLLNLDRFSRQAEMVRAFDGNGSFMQTALEMLTSGTARRAFDLNEESTATRDRYGRHRWGQMGLLARRLVESGVTFVTLNTAPDSLCWDWHRNIVNDHRPVDGTDGPSRGMDISGPPLDQMLAALITDIYERSLDRKVLLVVWGEFGRTPRINPTGGRDHWGSLMSILIAGGGLQVGQVIGTSSANGEVPANRPVSPTDVLATIYRHLGIDLTRYTVTNAGRPIPLLPEGTPIIELL
ncbi:MAG: DUF1501 domain-containing protein [Planctomycetota bacterium]|nr:MAG: DUF1501 domain-containing protein [Planctomycetota bacterium]